MQYLIKTRKTAKSKSKFYNSITNKIWLTRKRNSIQFPFYSNLFAKLRMNMNNDSILQLVFFNSENMTHPVRTRRRFDIDKTSCAFWVDLWKFSVVWKLRLKTYLSLKLCLYWYVCVYLWRNTTATSSSDQSVGWCEGFDQCSSQKVVC